MAGAPGKSGGGAVYVVFGSRNPGELATTRSRSPPPEHDLAVGRRPHDRPGHPTSTVGSRYDGFQQNSHTGMALAALPDVNGDGFNDLAVGAPDADLHITGGGGVAVLYGKPEGVHITLNDLWEKAYPYFFHIDFPALADQHVGTSVASVGDMTGDGLPDIAIGAPQADFNGTDSGSVWIISAHIAPIVGCTQPVPPETMVAPGSVCPWIKLNGLTAGQGYRIDGAAPGDQLGTSLAGTERRQLRDRDRRGGASPNGRRGRRRGRRRPRPGRPGDAQPGRDASAADHLRRRGRRRPGRLAGGGRRRHRRRHDDVLAGAPGEASGAGAAYLLQVAPGTTSDLALAGSKIAPAGAGSMTGSAVAAGLALDGAGADALVAAPGARAATAPGTSSAAAGRPCCRRLPARRLRPLRHRRRRPLLRPPRRRPQPRRRRLPRRRRPRPRPAAAARPRPPRRYGHPGTVDDHEAQDPGQAGRQEKEEGEAAALPGQEAQAEVPHGQGQARQAEAQAVPPTQQEDGGEEHVVLRRPGYLLGLVAAVVSFGVFSSSIGSGALPAGSVPAFGVTDSDWSLASVAELGDVNGDSIGDYAVGMPSADIGGSTDAGIVYVFLGHAGALPPTPTALNLSAASFTITGHAGEMLGFAVAGEDMNNDGLNDIAIGAPMAGAPGKSGAGAVYVIFGSHTPVNVATSSLYADGRLTNDPANPAPPSPIGSRYDGIVQDSHTGFSLAALPDVNGDELRRPRRRRARRRAPHQRRRRARRGLRQAPGRAHHAQRPLGQGLSVLVPRRLPLAGDR